MSFKKVASSFSQIVLFALCLIMFSCNNQPSTIELSAINGYWEITSVKTAEGKLIEYSFNETVDFIQLKDSTGVRTKVKPQLDGTFIATNDAEGFKVSAENDQLTLKYRTTYDAWDEVILYIDDSTLKVKNDRDMVYTYTRFKGYLDNGETK